MSERERLLSPLMELIAEGLDISEKENGKFNTFKFAEHLIANGVTIEQPQWISCAERLPVNEWRTFTIDLDWEVYPCLCTVKRIDGARYATKLFFTGENFVDAEYVRYTEQVTHWMPLPQPPKGDECL